MWGFLPLVALSGELEGLSLPGTEPWEGFKKTKHSSLLKLFLAGLNTGSPHLEAIRIPKIVFQ